MSNHNQSGSSKALTQRQKFVITFLAGAIMVFLCFGLAEVLLRLLPIPGINSSITTYDELVGERLYPGAVVRYYNDSGELIKRKVNQWGWLDQEWSLAKPAGAFRIGFFGDSYTEARQVWLDSCFFRRIEARFRKSGNANIQTLAFGCSGYSTLQSYLNCQRAAKKFDLDLVVYVFSENDLGDQLESVGGYDYMNRPFVVPDKKRPYGIDNAFRQRYAYRQNWCYHLVDYLENHSLLLYTIHRRIVLLRHYGVNAALSKQELDLDDVPRAGHFVVTQNDPPSQWPDSLRNAAKNFAAAIIADWKNDLNQMGIKFAVLDIPRQSQLNIPTNEQNSWKPWLVKTCQAQSISFIDPTAALARRANAGVEVYYDHFTAAGHDAVAETFEEWYSRNYDTAYFGENSPLTPKTP